MSDKPAALRLAEWLQAAVCIYPQMSENELGGYASEVDQVMDEAAAELRKLHAQREELLGALEGIVASWDKNTFTRERFVEGGSYGDYWSPSTAMVNSETIAAARAAIDKVRGAE